MATPEPAYPFIVGCVHIYEHGRKEFAAALPADARRVEATFIAAMTGAAMVGPFLRGDLAKVNAVTKMADREASLALRDPDDALVVTMRACTLMNALARDIQAKTDTFFDIFAALTTTDRLDVENEDILLSPDTLRSMKESLPFTEAGDAMLARSESDPRVLHIPQMPFEARMNASMALGRCAIGLKSFLKTIRPDLV